MATRALIGFVTEEGTVRGTYCHFDGNPAHVGKILAEEYLSEAAVNALTLFEMRAMEENGKVEYLEFVDGGLDQIEWESEVAFFEDWDRYGTEFHYLFKDGEWMFQSRWTKNLPNYVTLDLKEFLEPTS